MDRAMLSQNKSTKKKDQHVTNVNTGVKKRLEDDHSGRNRPKPQRRHCCLCARLSYDMQSVSSRRRADIHKATKLSHLPEQLDGGVRVLDKHLRPESELLPH